jgi:N-succinyldiaminopimelate aminotransferase
LTSLSKRSNVPGMRSGFVAGDAALIKQFLLYRTYHGSAMSPVVQAASIAAWNDEAHVVDNRRHVPRTSLLPSRPCSPRCMDVALPDASFYLVGRRACRSATTPTSRATCSLNYNVTVLPGSYLAREAAWPQSRRKAASAWLWSLRPKNALKPPERIVRFVQSRA